MRAVEFWGMTLADYKRKCHGKYKNDLRQWHHTRTIAYTFYKMNGGKESISKFMPLNDDTPALKSRNIDWAKANIEKIKQAYNGGTATNG